jgi:hypothetical protein
MQAFLFGFPCFCLLLFAWTYALNAMRSGRGRAYAPIAVAISSLRASAV